MRRRDFLRFGAAGALEASAPRILFAQAATERRFVFILQRGAADGLNTVIPYADPDYAKLRGALAIHPSEAIRLDGTFALHPSLVEMGKLYAAQEALFAQAVASPYRDRSHFDGQNVLESGGGKPYELKDGWMNRLVGLLPKRKGEAIALALAPAIPMALRGAIEVASYAPTALPRAQDDLMDRVDQLYANDAQLHAMWSAAVDARRMSGTESGGRNPQDPAALGRMAANFLAQAQGPRIAMIETTGWDTHSAQNARLANQLRGLDAMVAALRDGMGAAWKDTVVLVATEFGRTAAANGTGGTDHGTASAAMLAGGAVQGGRVMSDWPGLGAKDLYEGRDLKPTQGLDSLIAGVCAECFALEPDRTAQTLFPGVSGKPAKGLVRA